MAKGIFVVQSSAADAAHEPVYDEWYRNEHIPDVLAVPGFTGARRFRVVDGAPDAYTFVTIYELEAEDLSEPVREIYNRTRSGEMKIPDHARQGRPPATFLYELTGDYVPG